MTETLPRNRLHHAFSFIEQAHSGTQQIVDQILKAPVWSYSDEIHYHCRLRSLSHGEHNADMAMLYTVEYGLPPNIYSSESLVDINLAFDLHDIGKAEVPDPSIWDKKEEELTEAEREMMKTHISLAKPVLSKFEQWKGRPLPAIVYDVTLYHHEKLNGKGKAYGLVESDIGYFARLAACVDQIVGRCEDRRYHTRTYTLREAFDEVNAKAGLEFDEEILYKLGILLASNVHLQIPGMAWLGTWEQKFP